MTAQEDIPDWAEFPLFAPPGAEVPKLAEGEIPNEDVEALSTLSALSHLLHDDETPEEASELLRDQGNRDLKLGKHGTRRAIQKYTDAIEAAKGDVAPTAAALANRSAAELKLGNLGRAFADAEASLRLQPGQVKAHYRAALCAMKLGHVAPTRRHCALGMDLSADKPADKKAFDQLLVQLRVVERQARARAQREAAAAALRNSARGMMQRRGLRQGPASFALQNEYEVTEPVREDDEWLWPVLLVYAAPDGEPRCDYLQAVAEGARMRDVVDQIFAPGNGRPEWDVEHWYDAAEQLEIRYRKGGPEFVRDKQGRITDELVEGEEEEDGKWVVVERDTTLGELLDGGKYVVPLYPVLHVVPKWWR